MPGGEETAYDEVADIFKAAAAHTESGPCVAFLGPASAGHYVKMVHNGIEYAVMQLIAESYDLMRKVAGLSAGEMSRVFKEWDRLHQSYLMEISYRILERKDEETGKALVDLILDYSRQKGTGKWSVQDALELGEAIPTITAAVLARNISAHKEERLITAGLYEKIAGLSSGEMSRVFKEWDRLHQSYLMEISYRILEKKDEETGKALVDLILDYSRQKGTGKWSIQDALELGEAIPTITAAVLARNISAYKEERLITAGLYEEMAGISDGDIDIARDLSLNKEEFLEQLGDALYLGVIIAYAEGMKLLQRASREYAYGLKLDEVARIWEDGCIIRSALLKPIQQAYKKEPELRNLIISQEFRGVFAKRISQLRGIVNTAKKAAIPIPAMNAALDYFDSLCSRELPANLLQAQRDYFGAHTYERVDKEGFFHTEWQDIHNV